MPTLQQLRDERGQIIHDARAILDKAEAESRNPTAEERAKYDELFGKAEGLRDTISMHERQAELDRQAAEDELRHREAPKAAATGEESRQVGKRGTDEYRSAFERYLRGGRDALSADEVRALQSDIDASGGFMVLPEQMAGGIIKAMDNMTFIRQRATKFAIPTASSLGSPTLAADPSDADWTSELASGNEDSTMSFGKRDLHPHPLAKRLKVSGKLLRQVPGAETLVRDRLAYKFGVSQENAFLNGSGAGQPLGVFTASANGISTGRDVSTGNTTTGVTFDGLMGAKFSLKGQYWTAAEWIFHRDVLLQISKLKDGDGQYIWRESVRAGEPDRLLNLPVMMSEYAPNTMTTGLYVGLLGVFSHYWIADALDMQVQRLNELYAEANQVGFIGRLETDGMPTLEEAFARVKLA